MKRDLITITYSNIDKTDGPVIHYLELWNSFSRRFKDEFNVKGLACVTRSQRPFLIDNGFPIETISSNFPRPIRLILQDLFFAIKILRHRKSVIYIRTGPNMFLSIVFSRLLRVFLITEHNGIASLDAMSNKRGGLFSGFVAYMERLSIRTSTGCIGVSNGITDHLMRSGAKAAVCIRNGVSAEFFEVKPSGGDAAVRIVYVGTFTPWDGAAHIVELARKFPAVEFYLVGEGRHKAEVEASAEGLGNVFFKNFVEYRNLRAEYSKYDAGIVLYETERNTMELSSLKTLEYLACGLPIFSTRVPGQEFIEENQIGVLCRLDEVEAAFSEFLGDLPRYRKSVDDYRSTQGQQFSWDRTSRETRDFINSCYT